MKIRPQGAELFSEDRQTDVRRLLAAFRQFTETPKNTMRIHVFGNVIRRRCVVLAFQ